MTITLLCFGESGNAYKAALPLSLSGLDWKPQFVNFFKGENRTPEFRAMNNMGEVPVLIDGDVTITQSGVMQNYISEKSGKFGGATAQEQRDVQRWQFWDNHKMSSMAGLQRFLMNFLPEEKRPQEVIVGDGPTNADFSCCGYLYYPEPFGFERAELPNIDRWLTHISELPGWKHPYDLMPRKAD
jgi:glutathione S-transferase